MCNSHQYIGIKNVLLKDTTENTIDMWACYKLSDALNKKTYKSLIMSTPCRVGVDILFH